MQIRKDLVGERIVIRNYIKTDLTFVKSLWLDKENGKYLSDPNFEFVDDRYQEALSEMENNAAGYYLMIQDQKTHQAIGTCCAFPDENKECYDIGYCIDKRFWRQGYATESLALLLAWLEEIGALCVSAEVAIENNGSNALLRKFGFEVKKETSFKKYGMDIVYPSYIYELCLKNRRI